jgi:hypothetical protein
MPYLNMNSIGISVTQRVRSYVIKHLTTRTSTAGAHQQSISQATV